MARIFSLILFLAVLVIGLAFAVLNAEPVMLNYYFGSREVPLSMLLVLALILGAILGVLGSLFKVVRLRRENARLARMLKGAERVEKEVPALHALPLKDAQ